MDKWEYRLKSFMVLDDIKKLNEMGAKGWELVMLANNRSYAVIFKRKIEKDVLMWQRKED
jgi:hypothetical protein